MKRLVDWKLEKMSKWDIYSAAMIDISKASDTSCHDISNAMLHHAENLWLSREYLRYRFKVERFYSTWEELLTDVPKDSVSSLLVTF